MNFACKQESLLEGASEAEEESTTARRQLSDVQPHLKQLESTHSLRQLNFWLLYFVFGVSSANGLLFLNNCGKIPRLFFTCCSSKKYT